jgi:hypothetical protein
VLYLKIDTWSPQIVEALAATLSPTVTLETTPLPPGDWTHDGLWLSPDIEPAVREALIEGLLPLQPYLRVTPSLGADEAILRWREPAHLGPDQLQIKTNAPIAARRLLAAMAGFLPDDARGLHLEPARGQTTTSLHQHHLHPAFVQTMALLTRAAFPNLEGSKTSFDHSTPLTLSLHRPITPELAADTNVILFTDVEDDDPQLRTVVEGLLADGHVDIVCRPIQSKAHLVPFALHCGALQYLETPQKQIAARVSACLANLGVDLAKHPLEGELFDVHGGAEIIAKMPQDSPWDRLALRLVLPLRTWREGRLPPYGPGQAAVYLLTVQTLDPLAPTEAAILRDLTDLGFAVRTAPLPDTAFQCVVESDALHKDKALRGQIEGVLLRAGESAPHFVALIRARHHAIISLTTALSPEERARRALAARGRLTVEFCVAEGPTLDPKPAMERLRQLGYQVSDKVTISSDPEYIYVRAGQRTPRIFLRELEEVVNTFITEGLGSGGVCFDDPDPYPEGKVCINVPSVNFLTNGVTEEGGVYEGAEQGEDDEETELPSAPPPSSDDPFAAWVQSPARATTAFLRADGEALWVGAQGLPRRGAPTEAGADLAAWVIDDTGAATLAWLARAVTLRVPALLEGPTATSKTSAVLFLAHRLGQPVVRVNLSAHADTAELIGRFTPDPSSAGWRWQDGAVLRAVKDGCWLILDELNLAEPAVLERLNPLLEAEPSLLVTEHQGERFGPGGAPVHPGFRVFATLNPMTYGGRQRLSPALRDRFLAARTVTLPTQADLGVMVRHLTLGQAYTVDEGGRRYAQPSQGPLYPWPDVNTNLLDRIAGLFAGLMALAGDTHYAGLDEEGAERPVYTRRTLKTLLRDVSLSLAVGRGLDESLRAALLFLVVSRAAQPAHRLALAAILDANGLGPNTWQTAA